VAEKNATGILPRDAFVTSNLNYALTDRNFGEA
jgi:hypothetical protein